MRRFLSGALFCAVGLTPVAASANGFSIERATGGIVPRQSTTVAMKSEDLYLSAREIRVAYVFSSSNATSERVRMAFPLPAIAPAEPLSNGLENEANYVAFSVRVQGRTVAPTARQIATRAPPDEGPAPPQAEDVTARLAAAGLGPDFRGDEAWAKLRALPRSVLSRLKADGLIQYEDDPANASPAWRLQTIYEWEQDFAPGETRVDIRYVPLLGGEEGGPDEWFTPENRRRYCADPGVVAAATRWEKTSSVAPSTLTYIVTTARYWKGPIGRFRLTVDKAKPGAVVSFCPSGAKKTSPTTFTWEATDYVPSRDISVFFFPSP